MNNSFSLLLYKKKNVINLTYIYLRRKYFQPSFKNNQQLKGTKKGKKSFAGIFFKKKNISNGVRSSKWQQQLKRTYNENKKLRQTSKHQIALITNGTLSFYTSRFLLPHFLSDLGGMVFGGLWRKRPDPTKIHPLLLIYQTTKNYPFFFFLFFTFFSSFLKSF